MSPPRRLRPDGSRSNVLSRRVWLVGREAEFALVEECLGAAETRLAALAIVGDPGIGKTMLWEEAVRRARERGSTVLLTRPGESEARLAFAGLTDLLGEVGPEVLERLPAPQRGALEVALLRAEAGRGRRGGAWSARRCCPSCPSSRRPGPCSSRSTTRSGSTLRRRLRSSSRSGGWAIVASASSSRCVRRPRPDFVAALDDRQLRRLELGPLSVAALQRIVADRLGVTFPRPTLVRLAAAAKGNAFYALEIARLLAGRDPGAWTTAPLPVPDDLRTLVDGRIARLPRATRVALLRTAALARATSRLVDVPALAPGRGRRPRHRRRRRAGRVHAPALRVGRVRVGVRAGPGGGSSRAGRGRPGPGGARAPPRARVGRAGRGRGARARGGGAAGPCARSARRRRRARRARDPADARRARSPRPAPSRARGASPAGRGLPARGRRARGARPHRRGRRLPRPGAAHARRDRVLALGRVGGRAGRRGGSAGRGRSAAAGALPGGRRDARGNERPPRGRPRPRARRSSSSAGSRTSIPPSCRSR